MNDGPTRRGCRTWSAASRFGSSRSTSTSRSSSTGACSSPRPRAPRACPSRCVGSSRTSSRSPKRARSTAADVDAAIKDFQGALERVAKVFSTPNSGFDKYKQAFTVPSVEADDGGNYFYSPEKKKLYVINWGASPRSMAGRAEYVFGYEDWGKAFRERDAALAAAGSVSALAAAPVAGAGARLRPSTPRRRTTRRTRRKRRRTTARSARGGCGRSSRSSPSRSSCSRSSC